jgi:O-antigen ligase
LGLGWENFDYSFDSVVWPVRLDQDVYVDKAHSHFLEYLVTTGFVGFAIYTAILDRSLRNLFKTENLRVSFTFALVLFIVYSQTNIVSISEEVIFWVTMKISCKKLIKIPYRREDIHEE